MGSTGTACEPKTADDERRSLAELRRMVRETLAEPASSDERKLSLLIAPSQENATEDSSAFSDKITNRNRERIS